MTRSSPVVAIDKEAAGSCVGAESAVRNVMTSLSGKASAAGDAGGDWPRKARPIRVAGDDDEDMGSEEWEGDDVGLWHHEMTCSFSLSLADSYQPL